MIADEHSLPREAEFGRWSCGGSNDADAVSPAVDQVGEFYGSWRTP